MTASLTWVHVGDPHIDEADGWQSLDHLREIVRQVNEHVGAHADFVLLPGDNANHGTAGQYAKLIDAVSELTLPWRIIPGDHDFESGDLVNCGAAIPKANRPEAELIARHRRIFLDIVSAGAGGPDFRLTMHQRNRIAETLARAEAAGEVPVVFMHAYPGDLGADGAEVAGLFAEGRVAFVDTGHTHYSELLNDGRVIYGATRSTGQIEEGGGRPGFSVVSVYDRVSSWRFRRLDAPWPHVQIVAPCDMQLVTRPADPTHVPRPGEVVVTAKILGGRPDAEVTVSVDGGEKEAMWRVGKLWQGTVRIAEPALHRLEVLCGDGSDSIDGLGHALISL